MKGLSQFCDKFIPKGISHFDSDKIGKIKRNIIDVDGIKKI